MIDTLAQGPTNTDVMRVLMWIGLAIGALVLGGAGLMFYRKRMFQADSQTDVSASLFDELRRMQREGLMSQAEYDTARKKLAAKASQAMDRRTADRKAQKLDDQRRPKRRNEW